MIWDYFNAGGQVVIYDANNGTKASRNAVAKRFEDAGIHVVMLGTPPPIYRALTFALTDPYTPHRIPVR